MGGGLKTTPLYELPKNVTVKDEKIEIDTKNKLVDLLKLTCDAYKKLEGLKYRRYYKDMKLQLELMEYYRILVDYSNQLGVTYKKKFEEIVFSDFDDLEEAILSEDFGINTQWIWEMTLDDLPKLISFLQKEISGRNKSS
jgi:uncharacterized protein with HEPN domain